MGKRGPSPYPTNLRVLHGEKHKDRYNPDEPEPARGELPVPEDASPEVAKVWVATVEQLAAMDLAFPADVDTLRCYCEAVVSHRRACAVLAKSPVLIKGLHGNMVRNPALQIQRDAAAQVRAFAQEFGLTPSARSTIRRQEAGSAKNDFDNPLAGFGT